MKVLALYHPKSEHGRTIEQYVTDFLSRTGKQIELLSLETRDGAATASLYDIVRYPGILVLDDQGSLHRAWQGDSLPLMDEVAGYLAA